MALESLLSAKRKPAFVTPVTPRNLVGVTLKPLPILDVPLVTPVTPQNHEIRNEAQKAGEATASHWWLIHFADGEPLEVATTPASTHAEILSLYPSAVAAEPLVPTRQRPRASMNASDEKSIRAWLERIGETDAATVAEVMRQCRQDDEARRYFVGRSRKVSSGEVSNGVSSKTAPKEAAAMRCGNCRHFARPGLSSGYCGAGRADLLHAYGDDHPLRQLPEDGGASCVCWLADE
jgi:hypothetical protein